MTKITMAYRLGAFLLIAALLMFLLGDEVSRLFAPATARGFDEFGGGGGEELSWTTLIRYWLTGSGTAFLTIAGIADAWVNRPAPVAGKRGR